MTARDQPVVEPVHDTWRPWTGAGRWTWRPTTVPAAGDRDAVNAWMAGAAAALVDALGPFARVRQARLDGPADAPLQLPPDLMRAAGQPVGAFERAVIDAVRAAAVPITNLDLELDLRVWLRTAPNRPPERGWLAHGATASLFAGAHPDGSLRVDHTLFIDGALHGAPNHELHELNQPLLRDALAAIAARLGPIVETEGLPGITTTGFAPAAPAIAPMY